MSAKLIRCYKDDRFVFRIKDQLAHTQFEDSVGLWTFCYDRAFLVPDCPYLMTRETTLANAPSLEGLIEALTNRD